MNYGEVQKSGSRQPSLKNLTQVDFGKPKSQQNKVRTLDMNIRYENHQK